jgi:hypothetical protein
MNRVRVKSSKISSIGYDQEKHVLEIEFQTGSIYVYDNVPTDINEALMSAESHGKYYLKYIKDIFSSHKIR